MGRILIEKINAISELERAGWPFEPRSQDELQLRCPSHDDKTPSVNLNVRKNLWICHAAQCGASGDIVKLLALIGQVERRTILTDLMTRYDLDVVRTIKASMIEKYHDAMWKAGPLLADLHDRGVTDKDIKYARLGYHDGRITIPIFDIDKRCVNLRKYLPGAPGPEKFRDTRGYAKIRFYLPEQLSYDKIWIMGGEMKALASMKFLNPMSIGVVAVTGGEGAWDQDLSSQIKDKHIYLCMDVDLGGQRAADRLGARISTSAKSVHIVNIPLDLSLYPKGDINDWMMIQERTEVEWKTLQETAIEYELTDHSTQELSETVYVRLNESTNASNLGKRIQCPAIISAMIQPSYFVPREVLVKCGKDQLNCEICPVRHLDFGNNGGIIMEVKGTSVGILDAIEAPKNKQREATRESLAIPPCKDVEFETISSFNVTDVRLTPPLDIYGKNSEHTVQPAFLVTGVDLILNSPYSVSGRVLPHPRNQQAVLLIDTVDEAEDSLASFQPSETELKSLVIFQPKTWTVDGLQDKLDKIYADFEANVTRIYKRRNLHLALDLTWYSALYFQFDNRQQNGWVNCLITGDSSQGKSETTLQLLNHYGLGTRHDCKNATAAGLLGGVQQMGSRWFISWGVIPVHDRQLVIMEEIKGMPVEVLARLTDMRSSGVAEISMIEKRKTHARTRLIMISNPRSNRSVSAYSQGIEMLHELIGTQEDIRRFDFAIILAASHIAPEEINILSTQRKKVEHVYTAHLCKLGVLFAWTRTGEQIRFVEDSDKLCVTSAIEFCREFSEQIPLIDRGTMKYKIARLSIALAMRTFSSDDFETVLVRPCHVVYISKYLREQYTDSAFGYDDFTEAQTFHENLRDPQTIKKNLFGTQFPRDLVSQLLITEQIVGSDIQDWCDFDRDSAQTLLSLLVRKHAVVRHKRFYRKTGAFIAFLKKLKHDGVPEGLILDKEEIL